MEGTGSGAEPLMLTLHRGPWHVTEYASPGVLRMFGDRQVVGVPAREAFTDPAHRPLQRLMDLAYQSEGRHRMPFLNGLYSAVPRVEDGVVVGVATLLLPAWLLQSEHLRLPPDRLHQHELRLLRAG